MNHTTRRHPRSLADAFPSERFGVVSGPYTRPRRQLLRRLGNAGLWIGAVVLLLCLPYAPAVGEFLGFW